MDSAAVSLRVDVLHSRGRRWLGPIPERATVTPVKGKDSGQQATSSSMVRSVLRDPHAARLTVAYTCFNGAEYAVWIALMVYAYERGGTTESGIVAVSQLVPAGLLAPLAGVLAERRSPDRVLAYGYWAQSIAVGAAAATLALGGPALGVYGFTMLMTSAIVLTRPAQAMVTPRVARSVDGLTALNVVTEWANQVAMFGAPACAAGLLALGGPEAVFGLFAVALAVGATVTPRLPAEVARAGAIGTTALAEVRAGFRTAISEPAVRTVLLVNGLSFVTIGALDVITIDLAIRRFDGSSSTAAWMTATLGAGGILGAALGSRLIGRRLAPALVCATLAYGGSIALIGIFSNQRFVFFMLFVAGVGQVIVAISSQSILQRCSPALAIGRIFALREALFCLGLAAGSIAASASIAGLGLGGTLVAVGALLPMGAAVSARTIWGLDAAATVPVVELALLRRLPIFGRLPAPTLEGLARSVTPVDFEPGAYLMVEGEPGDRYLAIAAGVAEVSQQGVVIGTVTTGDGVGEIALLRDVPRTASVRADTKVEAMALGKEEFLIAVTGHPSHGGSRAQRSGEQWYAAWDSNPEPTD